VDALTSMRMLPSFNILKDVCGDWNSNAIVGTLSHLLEVAVSAYVASHATIFKDNHEIGEVPFSVAREKLSLACAAADTLSVEDLVRDAGLLLHHLTQSSSGDSLTTKAHVDVYRIQTERKLVLDRMRVTVESLAAELVMILGERMPTFNIPFADDVPKLATGSCAGTLVGIESIVAPSGTILLVNGVSEPACDYSALMQNTGDDHKFVSALLSSFKETLVSFCEGVDRQHHSMFDMQSLHGAAVSMFLPRVVDAIATIIAVASMDAQTARHMTADVADVHYKRNDADAVGYHSRDLRAAVDELARFIQTLEDGHLVSLPPSQARYSASSSR